MKSRPTILVVDDEVKIRGILKEIFESEGYGVILAKDGHEALQQVEKNDLNLVLLDLELPGLPGMDVLRKASESQPALPVIIITGYGTIQLAVEATRLGAYDFIEKPLDLKRILITVRNALAKEQAVRERKLLVENLLDRYRMIGVSRNMKEVYHLIEKVAPTHSEVLVTGESGTGKELVARAIHTLSPRVGGPFLTLNCPAIPENLIESELFGYVKGAFTGAVSDHAGMFEEAHGGTLFLDEIGDMALTTQSKVLQAIEAGEVRRIGETALRRIDVRIVTATNRQLQDLVKARQFREDLYYRLNVVSIHVPPLRERKDDISVLADHFLKQACEENKIRIKLLTEDARFVLLQHDWPGNVRELKNFIRKVAILTEGDEISRDHISSFLRMKPDLQLDFKGSLEEAKEEFEKQFLTIRLIANGWNFTRTAEQLNIDRATLYRKAKHYGIEKQS